MKKIIYICGVMAFLFCMSSAHAHPPYIQKQRIIHTSTEQELIVEKLFGDGVIGIGNPIRVQIRHKNGAVIAYTPTYSDIYVFCPDIRFCWAFPDTSILPIGPIFKLDYKNISFNPSPNLEKMEPTEHLQFQKYLIDKNTEYFDSYVLGYPEMNEGISGFINIPFGVFISPFAIFLINIKSILCLSIISSIVIGIPVFIFSKSENLIGFKKAVAVCFGTLASIFLVPFNIFIMFYSIIYFDSPTIYVLLSSGLGLFIIINRLLKKQSYIST